MEVNDQTLGVLRDLLMSALSNDGPTRKNAENYIHSQEVQRGFPVLVLTLIQRLVVNNNNPQDLFIRQSAAVLFKNVVKNHWVNEDEPNHSVAQEDKEVIKNHLVELMTTAPLDVQKQLAEAVSIISKYDFPHAWHNLLPQLVEKLQSDDIQLKKGVMLTANSLMKRFRYVFRSDELYSVLLICLQAFQEPLLKQFQQNHALILHAQNNKALLESLLETQRLIARIFFSLNWQDIPEYFEDHVGEWMAEFAKYLTYTNPLLVDDDEEYESGPVEVLQTAIIENLNLYATRYEEIFEPFLPQFAQMIWTLLVNVSTKPKYDYLAVGALKFLTSVASKQMNTALFTEPVLKDIMEHIIIRNLYISGNDELLFEDNVYDYIHKDFEGSDADTRRRSAIELTRSLMKFFAPAVTALGMQYFKFLMAKYGSSQREYAAKDAALHLLLAIALKGSSSQAGQGSGSGDINPSIPVLALLEEHVLPDLQKAVASGKTGRLGEHLINADCVKLICIFRAHLSRSILVSLLPVLVALLAYPNMVVQTYAALTIERFLFLRDKDPISGVSTIRLKKEDLATLWEPLIGHLFTILTSNVPEHANNEYVMKTLMRSLHTLGSDVSNLTSFLVPPLTALLERVCKQPVNPHYNHYLFECLAIVVQRATSGAAGANAAAIASQLESALFPPFQAVLAQDVSEFVPYVFQLLAQLLYASTPPGAQLSAAYKALFAPLLVPVLWEKRGNIPALTDLLRAYMARGMSEVIANQQLTAVLGVIQKLLASKSTEVQAFLLLDAVLQFCPSATLAPYISTLFSLLLQRMMESVKESKTARYPRLFLHMLTLCATVHGSGLAFSTLENLTPSLFSNIVRSIWTPNKTLVAQQYATGIDHKIIVVGGTKLLTETTVSGDLEVWGLLLKSIIAALSSSGSAPGAHGNKEEAEEELVPLEGASASGGADNAYSKLVFCQFPALGDPSPEIQSESFFFIHSLSAFLKSQPQAAAFRSYLQAQLDAQELQVLTSLCQQHSVALS
eukprot:gene3040-3317_t